ncbi:hypothetical protein Ahy_B08g091664 isoform B [Arachis hypogaea]|uniref:anthranilate synthase n=1 Tax=Arachis hypogaea TaxID=3818 RepID=A0A444Y2F1_ARAHY|nr:hypothetical protein Ahy_B08g091664 isoform B [Arachis hypogaea]
MRSAISSTRLSSGGKLLHQRFSSSCDLLHQQHNIIEANEALNSKRSTMNEVIAQLQHALALQEEADSNTSGDYNLLSVTFDPSKRRDRINEKMRALQDLIPNCNKSLDDWEGLDASAAHIANLLSTEPADGKIVRSPHGVMHGKSSLVYYDEKGEDGLFAGLSKYHSLLIEKESFPHKELEVTAWTEDGLIMAARHKKYKHLQGVQFHPESIITTEGKEIVQNFIKLIERKEAGGS